MAGSTPARRRALTGKGCAARGAIRAFGRRSRCCHAGARGCTRRSGYNRSARSGSAVRTGTAGGGRGPLRRKTRSANPRGGPSAVKTGAAGGEARARTGRSGEIHAAVFAFTIRTPGCELGTTLPRPRRARAKKSPPLGRVGFISSRGLWGLCPCEAICAALREQVHRVGAVSSRGWRGRCPCEGVCRGAQWALRCVAPSTGGCLRGLGHRGATCGASLELVHRVGAASAGRLRPLRQEEAGTGTGRVQQASRLSPLLGLMWSWNGLHRASHGICDANRWSVWRFNGAANAALGPSWCSRRRCILAACGEGDPAACM